MKDGTKIVIKHEYSLCEKIPHQRPPSMAFTRFPSLKYLFIFAEGNLIIQATANSNFDATIVP